MSNKSRLEILKIAREKISKEENWTQKAFAKNQFGNPVNGWDKEAVCWCAIGAIHSAGNALADLRILTVLNMQIPSTFLPSTELFQRITDYNDSKPHETVLEVFDKAIKYLEKRS